MLAYAKHSTESVQNKPRHEKTCIQGVQPGKTQIGSASEANDSLESLDLASRGIVLCKQRTTKVLLRLHECAG